MKELKNILDDKEFELITSMLSGNYSGISPDFIRIDRAFKIYSKGGSLSKDAQIESPEKHLMNMFKILHAVNIPFNMNMLLTITTLYVLRTIKHIYRSPRETLGSNSVYATIIGKREFEGCACRFKEVFNRVKIKSGHVPIDMKKGLELSIKMLDIGENIKGPIIDPSIVSPDLFDAALENKTSPFNIINNCAYPKVDVLCNANLEDL